SQSEAERITSGAALLSIGPTTSKAAAKRGLKITIEAEHHTIPGMIDTLLKYAGQHDLRRKQ
ncbi:MAG: hypothetical protein AB1744_15885, partial [Candidatus Zixiibacteriota bacterium]